MRRLFRPVWSLEWSFLLLMGSEWITLLSICLISSRKHVSYLRTPEPKTLPVMQQSHEFLWAPTRGSSFLWQKECSRLTAESRCGVISRLRPDPQATGVSARGLYCSRSCGKHRHRHWYRSTRGLVKEIVLMSWQRLRISMTGHLRTLEC
jgi:hypothetical protein